MAKRDVYRPTGQVLLERRKYRDKIADNIKSQANRIKSANAPKNSDTINRMNIHNDIKNMLSNGKKKVDIIIFLLNKYSDSNLSKYFEQWVDYHINKKDYFNIKNKDCNETR